MLKKDDVLATLVESYLHDSSHRDSHVLPKFQHRLSLASQWDIVPGSQILELGCGQGETTLVLAHLVGPIGSVVAVDPAPLDYGRPVTVSQARKHIKNSPYGSRIQFHALDPLDYLTKHQSARFSAVVLSHSLWYFASQSTILTTFHALSRITSRLCVAEYGFSASLPQQIPHVLAARGHALKYTLMTEHQRQTSTPNVRCAATPMEIKSLAEAAGFVIVEREGTMTPAEALADGSWEVKSFTHSRFEEEVKRMLGEESASKVMAFKPRVKQALEAVGGEGYRTMDVWWANLKKA